MLKEHKSIFTGVATAVVTPFSSGKVDYESLGNIIEFQISEGADAIVVCGTTGESATLDDAEKCGIIEYSLKKASGRVPVLAGTGCNNISKAVELSRFAGECGVNGILAVTPYYNKASKEGLIRSFVAIADAAGVPVVLYNVPSRTGMDIPLDVYKILSNHANIRGVKESSGSIALAERILAECGGSFDVYSGNDELAVPTISIGGKGVVSVASNIVPKRMHEMCKLALESKMDEAGKEQLYLMKLIDTLFSEVNPIPIKTAMNLMGLCSNEMRLPLCSLDNTKLGNLKRCLSEYKLI